jgi:uncharacterized protein YbjT (DUF2867 family)
MIVVTGATGLLGREIVDRLLARIPAAEIGVGVRDPERVADLRERGVRVRRGDFDDPPSLAHAFAGADQVLLVSTPRIGEPALRAHRAAIDAAVAAGVGRILYTSHMAAAPTSFFAPAPDHAATERHLRESGVAFTALRNGFYASTVPRLLGAAVETGELVAPEDGPVSWTALANLAEAAAITMLGAGVDGCTPALTAGEAIDLAGVAAIAAELAGRPIRRVVVSDDRYRESLVERGAPAEQADMLIGMFRAARAGEFAAVDPTLEQLLGRRPTALREVLREVVAAPVR